LHARTARSASARVSASGFSHMTALPACAAAMICAGCCEFGVASTIILIAGSASSSA
jgi:hypothetical protein